MDQVPSLRVSLRVPDSGNTALTKALERKAGPQSQAPFKSCAQRETHDDIARPMRQHQYARQREAERQSSDRSTGNRGQRSGRRGDRAHMQGMAGGKRIIALARKGNAVEMSLNRPAVGTGLVEYTLQAVRQQ